MYSPSGDFGYSVIDPNIRAGMEIGMYSCEKSIRQMWRMNSNHSLELYTTAIDTEATDGYMAQVCIGPGDPNRPFLTIIICEGAARAALVLRPTSAGQLVDSESGLCVTLAGGVREPGALLNLSPCLPKYPIEPTMRRMRAGVEEAVEEVTPSELDFIAADHQVFVITAQGTLTQESLEWPPLTAPYHLSLLGD
jgi:hypothetical protein